MQRSFELPVLLRARANQRGNCRQQRITLRSTAGHSLRPNIGRAMRKLFSVCLHFKALTCGFPESCKLQKTFEEDTLGCEFHGWLLDITCR